MKKTIYSTLLAFSTIILTFVLLAIPAYADNYYGSPVITVTNVNVYDIKTNSLIGYIKHGEELTPVSTSRIDRNEIYIFDNYYAYKKMNFITKKDPVSNTVICDAKIYKCGSTTPYGIIKEGSTIDILGHDYLSPNDVIIFKYNDEYFFMDEKYCIPSDKYADIVKNANIIMNYILNSNTYSVEYSCNSFSDYEYMINYINAKYYLSNIFHNYSKFDDTTSIQSTYNNSKYTFIVNINKDNYNRVHYYMNKANKIIASLNIKNKSDKEKAIAISNYLADTISYDWNYKKHGNIQCLLDKQGVCLDYSVEYELLCTLAGLQAQVCGGGTDFGAHAWNRVCIDGAWYWTDICSYDTDSTGIYNTEYLFSKELFSSYSVSTYNYL